MAQAPTHTNSQDFLFESYIGKKIMAREDISQFSTGLKVNIREKCIGTIQRIDNKLVYVFNDKNPEGYQHFSISLSDFVTRVNSGLYCFVTPRNASKESLDAVISSADLRSCNISDPHGFRPPKAPER